MPRLTRNERRGNKLVFLDLGIDFKPDAYSVDTLMSSIEGVTPRELEDGLVSRTDLFYVQWAVSALKYLTSKEFKAKMEKVRKFEEMEKLIGTLE